MKMTIFIAVLIAVSVMPVFASQYEGKIIDSNSLYIEFGKDAFDIHGEITPTINKAMIKSDGVSIPLYNPTFKERGSSFVLKSFEDDFNLITYGESKGDSFNLRTSMYAGNGLLKFNDVSDFKSTEAKPIIEQKTEDTQKNNLHTLVQSPKTVFNGEQYHYDLKTFDKSKYSGNDFHNFNGKVDGVEVVAVVKDPDGKIIDTQNGVTKFGVYQGSVYIPENLWARGWYIIDISSNSELGQAENTIVFYVMGQTADKDGSICPSGQSLVNGVCQ